MSKMDIFLLYNMWTTPNNNHNKIMRPFVRRYNMSMDITRVPKLCCLISVSILARRLGKSLVSYIARDSSTQLNHTSATGNQY